MGKTSKAKNTSEYGVGYGKPPAQSRFQKGESGNPNGRPKGTVNVATVLLRTLNEKTVFNENGHRKVITKLQASVRQLVNKAASGDLRALTFLVGLMRSTEQATSEETTPNEVLSEPDHKIMLKILKRYAQSLEGGDSHETSLP